MVFDPTNTNQVRTWIKDAPPEELLTIAPVLFNRIGTLGKIIRRSSSRTSRAIRKPSASSKRCRALPTS